MMRQSTSWQPRIRVTVIYRKVKGGKDGKENCEYGNK